MKKIFAVARVIAVLIILMFLAVPAAGAQDLQANRPTKQDESRIVCPAPVKTGDPSFDAFLKNLEKCKAVPVNKHWWEFWKRSHRAVRTRKIRKGSTSSSALFLSISIRRIHSGQLVV